MDTLESTQRNRGPRHRARALARAFGVLGAVALALSLMAISSAQAGPPVWRDEFDSESLDPAWFWLNENPDGWNLSEESGYTRIYASPYPTGGENLLLRSGAQGNFTIETHVLFAPHTNFQFAGLVIYQDQTNFLQLGRAVCDLAVVCVGNGVYFDRMHDGGLIGSNFATATVAPNEAFLRLERRGRNLVAFYSEDGTQWREIGRHRVPASFQVNAVGLTSSQDYSGLRVPADFDYFSLTGQPQPSSPFVGHWEAIDVDASDIRLTIGGPASGPFRITWTESYISFCDGEAGIVRGAGWLNDADPHLLEADLHLECFTTGAQLDFHVTWRYDLPTDTISWTDWNGVIITWHRPGRPLPAPALFLRVNYGHDWVESFYEAGHVVRITVTDADGNPKATAQMYTQPRPEWGGEPGFQTQPDTWDAGQPDIQPRDWVIGEVLDNGQVARVQIGDISGAINLDADSISGTIDATWFTGEIEVQCMAWGAPGGAPDKSDVVLPDGGTEYACSWPAEEWDIQPGQDVGVGYSGPDGHWVANAFFARNSRIIASAAGDWFWTTDFNAGVLNLFIYESADEGADLLWQGSRNADEWGFVFVGYEDHLQDLAPGNYLVVSDMATEKGLVLETITMEVFDTENEIMAGTAPNGKEVLVVAGMADPETQATRGIVADPQSGAWMADFTEIDFDITEEMRAWSFVQIFDEDGDANEASPPPPPAPEELWVAAFTYDVPAGTWTQGPHSYYYVYEFTEPVVGGETTGEISFTISSDAVPYDGLVLLRPGAVRARIEGGADGGCPPINPTIRPDQATRFLWGGLTDAPMTYEEAAAHFDSAVARVYWDGESGGSALLDRQEILEWEGVDWWLGYVCSFASPPPE